MNAEDLLIIGAIGVGIYYVINQSTTAAAASPTSPSAAPMAPTINVQPSTIPLSNPISSLAPVPAGPVPSPSPMAPVPAAPAPAPVMAIPPPPTGMTYTIQPYGPATPLAPTPGPAPPPPIPADYTGPVQLINADPLVPYPSPTTSGPTPPAPTVQPGIVSTAPAPVAQIQIAPAPVAPAPTPGPAIVPAAPVYNPQMTYSFSRAGSTLYPGDTWSINIWGAKPGSPVTMTLTQQYGSSVTNQIGTVNSSGNFWYTGSIDTGTDGNWTQTWYVGGQQLSSFSFTVFDPTVNAVIPTTTYNANIPNTPIGTAANPQTGPLIIGGVVYQTPLYI